MNLKVKNNKWLICLAVVVIVASFVIMGLTGITEVKAEEITPFGAITPEVKGDGTKSNPYIQAKWNGRIESTENLHDNYYAYISINVRDCGIFHDDALVAYNYYHLNTNNEKITSSLPKFSATLIFMDKKGPQTKTAGTKDRGNWEYLVSAGKFNITSVKAEVTITDGESVKTIYYSFG